ncbi:hypothetical protein L210DRAFT_3047668 [Boletus edulis BED1]|uniref:Uncharacterized protein n=1 Tax=Boletus edulis BED1 TaxID=1328754 RepID=A0AAD4C0F2_BOLED|nr:hypothetical protein L210DRAFT_3047668 [Boletus edulis BED1]
MTHSHSLLLRLILRLSRECSASKFEPMFLSTQQCPSTTSPSFRVPRFLQPFKILIVSSTFANVNAFTPSRARFANTSDFSRKKPSNTSIVTLLRQLCRPLQSPHYHSDLVEQPAPRTSAAPPLPPPYLHDDNIPTACTCLLSSTPT